MQTLHRVNDQMLRNMTTCLVLFEGVVSSWVIRSAFMNLWSINLLLRRVLYIHCQIDSSQCLAQLTPARVGKAGSVHVQLGASPHVIR